MRLCHIDELPERDARGFDPYHTGQDSLLVVRQDMHLFAYLDACPHHGTPMAWRRHAYLNGTRDRIVCAAHGAQFEIGTGLCTLGPCLGEHLQTVDLTVHLNGEVHIADPLSQET